MYKKLLMVALLLLVLSMMPMGFVQSVPLTEKNNDKFESFSVIGKSKFSALLNAPHEYIPSIDNANILVITEDEVFLTYDIKIGEKTYKLNEDFAYTGTLKWTFYEPVLPHPVLGYSWPLTERAIIGKVDYMFDFSAVPGGIEGTIALHATNIKGQLHINSLAGTGELQNVQIQAVAAGGSLSAGIVTIIHEGIVFGWPE